MRDHLAAIKALQDDETIPLCSHNVVYLVKGDESETIDRDILYSILDKDPKRAYAYWFISVNTTNDPNQKHYKVETFGTDYIFRVNLYLGFKVRPSVNIYLRQVVEDLLACGCDIAYNLDGGRSSMLVFMGKAINKSAFIGGGWRGLQDMVGFLTSELVPMPK